jgi:hypothetical protein
MYGNRHPLRAVTGAFALLGGACLMAAASTGDDLPPAATVEVDFARDIRPIFEASCVSCHGPAKQKGGLRLDRKDDLFAGGDSGAAFEPGKSAEGLLIEKVAGVEGVEIMPPDGQGAPLLKGQIGLLRAWIDQGARWPDGLSLTARGSNQDHWAFRPPSRPPVPALSEHSGRVRGPIDAFILSRLEDAGLAPNPEADRSTLIRRLSLDLTGLPPLPEDVDAFLLDNASDAYERLVDRLLASPRFGERWGRHWLDLARYADSDGYEKDSPRPFAYRYRDWVIDAINRDLPFDRFTIEQLAGDLLPGASLDQRIATGFHRNTLTNREGGTDAEEFRVAAVVDRVNTTGTTWLGLTVGCAQCHTHKYDPITQREYYGLFAFFNNADERDVDAPLPGEAESFAGRKSAYDADHAPYLAAIASYERDELPAARAAWERRAADSLGTMHRWTPLAVGKATSAGKATLTPQGDGSVLATGESPPTDTYTLEVAVEEPMGKVTGFRVEALDDPSLPSKGPGRTDHGNFVLTEFRVAVGKAGRDDALAKKVALQHASADFSQDKFPAADAIDGKPKTGWAVAGKLGMRHAAVFEVKEPFDLADGHELVFTLDQQYGQRHTLGRVRVSLTTAEPPIVPDDVPDDVLATLAIAADDRTDDQAHRLAEYHRAIDPGLARLRRAADEHAKKAPAAPASKAPTLTEREEDRRATHVLTRGDFLRPGASVSAGTLGVLHPPKAEGEADGELATRLDLAKWLVDPANPLTARVQMNRVWRHLLGRPLVASMDDFGTRGERPTHPELLDWLATEFVARGWGLKAMIKEIALSATYRQSSTVTPAQLERDPGNVLLSRQTRQRLEAEVLRDASLAAAGLLTDRIGGPSVRPPQPEGTAELTYAGSAKWVESTGADRYRRGMYTWFQRTSPYPMLMTFDAPDGNVCVVRRERSNTPLQALTLLNDGTFVECAQALAKRILDGPDGRGCNDCRVGAAYRICLARGPSSGEALLIDQLYQGLLAEARAHPEAAAKLVGPRPPAKADPADAAAWVALARTLLNLDEFVTRE